MCYSCDSRTMPCGLAGSSTQACKRPVHRLVVIHTPLSMVVYYIETAYELADCGVVNTLLSMSVLDPVHQHPALQSEFP
jgi:hypothetical protein